MKKTVEYLKELFEEPFELEEDSIEKDFYIVIKAAQEDAIREAVEECSIQAKAVQGHDALTWEPKLLVDKQSIFSVADKLIKEL